METREEEPCDVEVKELCMIEDLLKRQYNRKIRQLHSDEKEQIRERIRCLETTIETLDYALKYGTYPHTRLPHNVPHYGSREGLSSNNSDTTKVKQENSGIHSNTTSDLEIYDNGTSRLSTRNNSSNYQTEQRAEGSSEDEKLVVICPETAEDIGEHNNVSNLRNNYVLSPHHTSSLQDDASQDLSSEASISKTAPTSPRHKLQWPPQVDSPSNDIGQPNLLKSSSTLSNTVSTSMHLLTPHTYTQHSPHTTRSGGNLTRSFSALSKASDESSGLSDRDSSVQGDRSSPVELLSFLPARQKAIHRHLNSTRYPTPCSESLKLPSLTINENCPDVMALNAALPGGLSSHSGPVPSGISPRTGPISGGVSPHNGNIPDRLSPLPPTSLARSLSSGAHEPTAFRPRAASTIATSSTTSTAALDYCHQLEPGELPRRHSISYSYQGAGFMMPSGLYPSPHHSAHNSPQPKHTPPPGISQTPPRMSPMLKQRILEGVRLDDERANNRHLDDYHLNGSKLTLGESGQRESRHDWEKPLHIDTDQRLMMVVPEHQRTRRKALSEDSSEIRNNLAHYQSPTSMPLLPLTKNSATGSTDNPRYRHLSSYPPEDEPLDLCGGSDDGRSASGDDALRGHASQIVPASTKEEEDEKYQIRPSSVTHDSKPLWSPASDHVSEGSSEYSLNLSQQYGDQDSLPGTPSKKQRTHSGCYCKVCGKVFRNSSALTKHRLIHSDERRYVCPHCPKAFKRRDHLKGHLVTHDSVKPFRCTNIGCQKSYCDVRSLRRHLEITHNIAMNSIDSTELLSMKPEPREIVPGAALQLGNNLNIPANVGGMPSPGQQSIQCEVCKKSFKNLQSLHGHARLHGGLPSSQR